MRNNPCLEIARAELERAGIRDVEVAHGGKHPQLRFRVNGGPLHVFTVPGSSGDQRMVWNVRSELRRLLRELGVSTTPERSEQPPRPAPKPDRFAEIERRLQALEDLVRTLKTGGYNAHDQ